MSQSKKPQPYTKSSTTSLNFMTRRVRRWAWIGLACTLIGGLLYLTLPDLIKSGLKSQLQITEEPNEFTKMWTKVPFPAQLSVHLFTITNPDEFTNGAKARLKEMGPYTYE